MIDLIENLKSYLNEALNVSIDVHRWKNPGSLPFFLTDSYEFFKFSIFEQPCLLMVSKENVEITPGLISKHYRQVQKSCDDCIIYAQLSLSSYNRKRLVEHNIPFIIPGNQMYLPHLGIDLREHFLRLHAKKDKAFSPASQAVVIYALIRQTKENLTSSHLAKELGYTLMTINRVFAELKATQIGEFFQEGRERCWTFSDKRTLWKQATPFLRSPVKKRLWLKSHQLKIIAGLTALSHLSLLAPPPLPVFAASMRQWEIWQKLDFEEVPSADGADTQLEIWHYDPELFAKNNIADPFSLYLSLKANQDERIESALEEMMEKIEW
jgi:hypothetical protein